MSGGSIVVRGIGAVSPAGWGAGALHQVVRDGVDLGTSELIREHGGVVVSTPVRRVPEPADKSSLPKHPRLRRASPAARYAAAAAAEALGAERATAVSEGSLRLGIVCALMNGCVIYSNRFYGEVLADPALASPILFPETVFNAPSSHLSALFGSTGPNDTLIGDSAEFAAGLELAAEWLERGEVDGCLVVSTEELDWLSAEGLRLYARGLVAAEGAGAIYLERGTGGVRLLAIPDPEGLRGEDGRAGAMRRLRAACGVEDDGKILLVDGCAGAGAGDRIERGAWSGWTGPRVSPRKLLGEAMGASMAWQAVHAVAALQAGEAERALVSALGGNEQAAAVVWGWEDARQQEARRKT